MPAYGPEALAEQVLLLLGGAWVAVRMLGQHNPAAQVAASALTGATAEPGAGRAAPRATPFGPGSHPAGRATLDQEGTARRQVEGRRATCGLRDVMSSPVVTVAPDAHLKDVAATLVERGINAVPVVEEGDRLVGIVTEADLLTLEAALTPGARPGSLAAGKGPPHTAGEVMSRSVYTLTEDTDATDAARLMLRHRLKSVPVVAGDRVVGIVARRDLLRLVARGDNDIRADLQHRLQEQVHALQRLDLHVEDGVVTIDGPVGPLARQLVDALARTVPGVLEVRSTTSSADGR